MKTTLVLKDGSPAPKDTVVVVGAVDRFVIDVQSMNGVGIDEVRRLIGEKRKVGHAEHVQRQYTVE